MQTDDELPGWEALREEYAGLVASENDFIANGANLCALIARRVEDIAWVGLYLNREGELVLGPFQGEPSPTRIAWGEGICGSAAATAQSLIVADLQGVAGQEYAAEGASSLMAVPLRWQDNVVGVLRLDSEREDRFDEADREGVEALIGLLLGESDLWSAFGTSG